jgi:hypothetical protein
VILHRPVGLEEMRLLVESDLRSFPPRLPAQPIFYPVLTPEYAVEIARDWNTKDSASGFAGYVTRFEIPDAYAVRFDRRRVGAHRHEELWVPAAELERFNSRITAPIAVTEAFFGPQFRGHIPARFHLAGKDAIAQFATLAGLRRDNPADFFLEIGANHTAVFLHYLFWFGRDFHAQEITPTERNEILRSLEEEWARTCPTLALPGSLPN